MAVNSGRRRISMPGNASGARRETGSSLMFSKKSGETSASPSPGQVQLPSAPVATNGGGTLAEPTPVNQAQGAKFRYVDRPDCPETFADSITGLAFDGQTLRLEFAVTRVDEIKANTPVSGRRYPACRLVLPPAAAIDLINKMQQVAAALTQAGMLKPTQKAAAPTKGS
jgi:hypothetical protein